MHLETTIVVIILIVCRVLRQRNLESHQFFFDDRINCDTNYDERKNKTNDFNLCILLFSLQPSSYDWDVIISVCLSFYWASFLFEESMFIISHLLQTWAWLSFSPEADYSSRIWFSNFVLAFILFLSFLSWGKIHSRPPYCVRYNMTCDYYLNTYS